MWETSPLKYFSSYLLFILVRDYLTYEKISEALANLEVKGVLVDLYVLSTHKHLFGDPRFRIVRVYDYKTSYGAVIAGQAMKLQHCFTKEIKENAADAFKSIDENVKILKVLRTFRRFAT